MAKLILYGGPVPQEFTISGETTVGRQPDNTIQIPEPKASRKHARVVTDGPQFVLEDMASANGTEVNGQKVTRHVLKHGDMIQIGGTSLLFQEEKPAGDDALFAPTMIGGGGPAQDPMFAATMAAGANAGASPTAPARLAPGQASVPTVTITSPASVQFVKPKRKPVLVVCVLLFAVLVGAYCFWPESVVVENAAASVKALFDQHKYEETVKLAQQYEGQGLSPQDRAKVVEYRQRAEVELEVSAIRALIYEKSDFGTAASRAEDVGAKYGVMADRVNDLLTTAYAARAIVGFAERNKNPLASYDPKKLDVIAKELEQLRKKYEANKTEMEKLPAVREAYQRAVPELDKVLTRIDHLERAAKAWDYAKAARQKEDWTGEVEALKTLQSCAPDVVQEVAKEKADYLLRNADCFLKGREGYNKGNYDLAVQSLNAVDKKDFHWSLAQDDLDRIAKEADYREAVRLYRTGQAARALETLRNARTPKAAELQKRIVQVQGKYEELLGLYQRKAYDPFIASGDEWLAKLDRQFDSWYIEKTAAMLKSSRDEKVANALAKLEELAAKEQYEEYMKRDKEFRQTVSQAAYPDAYQKALQLNERVVAEMKTRATKWRAEAQTLWENYQREPIGPKERTASDATAMQSFVTKAKLLEQIYVRADKARQAVELLPEKEKADILDLYERVRAEIVGQSEKLFDIRRTYNNMGNFDMARQAKQKILSLPEVPGNQWQQTIKMEKEVQP